jgi:tetratricopeptide (TPR) repeat protein
VVFLVCGLLPSLAAGQSVDEQRQYAEVQALIDEYPSDQDGLVKASQALKGMAKAYPDSALTHIALGRLAYRSGYINYNNFDEESLEFAEAHLDKALRIQPTSYDANYYASYLYINKKDYRRAMELAENARRIAPDSPKTGILFGKIAKGQTGDPVEVERLAKGVVERTTDKYVLTDAYGLLVWSYKVQRRFDLAEQVYIKLLEIEPMSPWEHMNYSDFLVSQGRFDQAIVHGKQALALADFGMGHAVLAKAYYQKGVELMWEKNQPDQAMEYFDQAVQNDPEHANAYYGLGVARYKVAHARKSTPDLRAAEQALARAVALNPNFDDANRVLTQVRRTLRAVER